MFDLASKLQDCYHEDGSYAHGDLRAASLTALLEREQWTEEREQQAQGEQL